MNATIIDRVDAESTGVHSIDPYAAIVDQLQHTVMQLVRATLENARSDAGLTIAQPMASRPLAALAALVPTVPALPMTPPRPAACTLSQREREVLQRIAAGDSNKMIARALTLSPHTVKRHVANILDKLGARTRSQAAAWLQRTH